MAKLFIPNKLPKFLGSYERLINDKNVVSVPIEIVNGHRKRNCFLNVKSHIETSIEQNEMQYGWTYTCLGNVMIRLIGHVVVRKQSGGLLCVTPPEFDIDKIPFIPDNQVGYQMSSGDRLPSISIPIINNPYIKQYAEQENIIQSIREKYPARTDLSDNNNLPLTHGDTKEYRKALSIIQNINNQKLLSIFKENTSRNDQCYCGSGNKFKKCCIS